MAAPASVLIVEDDRDIREGLADALGAEGIRPIAVRDGIRVAAVLKKPFSVDELMDAIRGVSAQPL